jgi:octaprenyl-diphosphate synthase
MADVWDAYRDELEGMERQARTNLDSSVALVNTVAAHILNSGGKRIRPFLLLLSARLCGYTGRDHYQLASLVEFIHTASLLHDDVVDDADIRRGRRTARKVWGNQISILVGDYLYSKLSARSSTSGTMRLTKCSVKLVKRWRKAKCFSSITTATPPCLRRSI